jgi:hypothetical protein
LCLLFERDEESMKALCEGFGISRETGYVWLRRYRQHGIAGLVELNRAPRSHPEQDQRPLAIRQPPGALAYRAAKSGSPTQLLHICKSGHFVAKPGEKLLPRSRIWRIIFRSRRISNHYL